VLGSRIRCIAVAALFAALARPRVVAAQTPAKPFVLGAYAEVFYQWNFQQPANGITNYRGFDNRNDTFTISNVAVDTRWDYQNVVGHVALQVGHTPSTYYLAEPRAPGSAGTSASDAELWKYVQEAWVGYRVPVGRGLLVNAGVFLSPIGPESLPVKDNWNWSRSNLFFGLPFYHTGIQVTYPVGEHWEVMGAVYNGWNSVVDNNHQKSFALQAHYNGPGVELSVLYFGGVERPTGAPEGNAFRNLFDTYFSWDATGALSVGAELNGGFERNTFGTSGWVAGALYARLRLLPILFAAARGDVFWERDAQNALGRASPISFSVEWVASPTLTLDLRPIDHVCARLELRHDQAASDLYFGGAVTGDGVTSPYVPNRPSQDTLTLGMTTWF
jgi:hypothetical protein